MMLYVIATCKPLLLLLLLLLLFFIFENLSKYGSEIGEQQYP